MLWWELSELRTLGVRMRGLESTFLAGKSTFFVIETFVAKHQGSVRWTGKKGSLMVLNCCELDLFQNTSKESDMYTLVVC